MRVSTNLPNASKKRRARVKFTHSIIDSLSNVRNSENQSGGNGEYHGVERHVESNRGNRAVCIRKGRYLKSAFKC